MEFNEVSWDLVSKAGLIHWYVGGFKKVNQHNWGRHHLVGLS